jgi:hypothetical protein
LIVSQGLDFHRLMKSRKFPDRRPPAQPLQPSLPQLNETHPLPGAVRPKCQALLTQMLIAAVKQEKGENAHE